MKKTVLIVEDTPDIQWMMKFMVESCGFRVLTADDGLQAVEVTRAQRPDLILMDIMMPGMDGIAATRLIRELVGKELPILALTAYDERYHEKALAVGCDEVFRKPLDFDKFEDALKRYLS